MSLCLVAGIDSPLRGDVCAQLKKLRFDVVTARSFLPAYGHVCSGTLSTLVILDTERQKEIVPMDCYGNPCIPKERVTDSGYELIRLLADPARLRQVIASRGGVYPRTLIVTDRQTIFPKVDAVIKTDQVSQERFERIFGDIAPLHKQIVAA